jgi:hypothetical protein
LQGIEENKNKRGTEERREIAIKDKRINASH